MKIRNSSPCQKLTFSTSVSVTNTTTTFSLSLPYSFKHIFAGILFYIQTSTTTQTPHYCVYDLYNIYTLHKTVRREDPNIRTSEIFCQFTFCSRSRWSYFDCVCIVFICSNYKLNKFYLCHTHIGSST